MRNIYWSFICPLLALVCVIAAFPVLNSGATFAGMGLSIMGFYMLLLWFIWLHFAVKKTAPPPGDMGFLVCCALGFGLDLALIVGSFSEIVGNWVTLGSLLLPMLAYPVSSLCEKFFPRPAQPCAE